MGETADILLGGGITGCMCGGVHKQLQEIKRWWLGKWLRRKEVTLKIYAMGRGLSFKHGV